MGPAVLAVHTKLGAPLEHVLCHRQVDLQTRTIALCHVNSTAPKRHTASVSPGVPPPLEQQAPTKTGSRKSPASTVITKSETGGGTRCA